MQKQSEHRSRSQDTQEAPAQVRTHKRSEEEEKELDALLDEIDEVLESPEQEEIEKIRFKEKLRSLSFAGRRAALPCSEVVRVPRPIGEHLGLEKYSGPPCVDC